MSDNVRKKPSQMRSVKAGTMLKIADRLDSFLTPKVIFRLLGYATLMAACFLLHLYAMNRGILLTPFHNMALMSPVTSKEDIDQHTKIFRDTAKELVA